MQFKVGFYRDSDPVDIIYEFIEANTFFKAVSSACDMKPIGWSQYSVTEVFDSAVDCDCFSCKGNTPAVCLSAQKSQKRGGCTL